MCVDTTTELEELQNMTFRHLMAWKKYPDSKFSKDEILKDITDLIVKGINSGDTVILVPDREKLGFVFKSRLTDILDKANMGYDVQMSMSGRITITPTPLKAKYSLILSEEPTEGEYVYRIAGVIMGKELEDK